MPSRRKAKPRKYIPHDRLCRDLLQAFFLDFLQIFAPAVWRCADPCAVTFVDRATLSGLRDMKQREPDLVAKMQTKREKRTFLVHVEVQARRDTHFGERMLFYGVRLHEKFGIPVYPIAVFLRRGARRNEPDTYIIGLPDIGEAPRYTYQTIDLGRLEWRAYIDKPNPAVSALMSVMKINREDRAQVKWECLRMAASLGLDMADLTRIGRFVEAYLDLNEGERTEYNKLREGAPMVEKEAVTEILTYWERKGHDQGLELGLKQGRLALLLKQLEKRFGAVPGADRRSLECLDDAGLDDLALALMDATSYAAWRKRLISCVPQRPRD